MIRAASFAGLAAYRTLVTGFAHRRDEPAQTKLGLGVSGNFFDVLELRPALGRFFLPKEDRVPGRDPVIVLAYDTWMGQFGGDPAVVGPSVGLAGLDLTIVGVAPRLQRHAPRSAASVLRVADNASGDRRLRTRLPWSTGTSAAWRSGGAETWRLVQGGPAGRSV